MFTTKRRINTHFAENGQQVTGRLTLELARTPEEQALGLMYRDDLKRNEGMLFLYEKPGRYGFWMKNTPIPLDIAWLDETGHIMEIQQMQPFDERLHEPARPAKYVVEFNAGFFARHELGPGARLVWVKS